MHKEQLLPISIVDVIQIPWRDKDLTSVGFLIVIKNWWFGWPNWLFIGLAFIVAVLVICSNNLAIGDFIDVAGLGR